MFLEGWNETILIGIQTFVWPIRTWEKQYFDAQNKKNKNKSNERKQITDLISDVNLKLALVPFGGFRGVKKTLMWIPEKGNKNKQKQRQRNKWWVFSRKHTSCFVTE